LKKLSRTKPWKDAFKIWTGPISSWARLLDARNYPDEKETDKGQGEGEEHQYDDQAGFVDGEDGGDEEDEGNDEAEQNIKYNKNNK